MEEALYEITPIRRFAGLTLSAPILEDTTTMIDDAYEILARLTKQDCSSIEGIQHQLPIEEPVPNDANAWINQAVQQNLSLLASNFAVTASLPEFEN